MSRDVDLGKYTTLGIGGMAKWLTEAETETELGRAVEWAEKNKVEWTVIGAGSNLLVSDQGYSGLIIVNKTAGSGMMLNDLVDQMNSRGLAGMECLAGIPGSVGGAVYGNAGAYGQTISDYLVGMKTLNKFWLNEALALHFCTQTSLVKPVQLRCCMFLLILEYTYRILFYYLT